MRKEDSEDSRGRPRVHIIEFYISYHTQCLTVKLFGFLQTTEEKKIKKKIGKKRKMSRKLIDRLKSKGLVCSTHDDDDDDEDEDPVVKLLRSLGSNVFASSTIVD